MSARNFLSGALRAMARRTRTSVESLARTIVRPFGLTIGPVSLVERAGRLTYRRALEHVKGLGFKPRTVIDVGVATGTWPLYDVFRDARVVLVEPILEVRPHLEAIVSALPHAEYVLAAACSRRGRVVMNVPRDTARSSTRWESDFQPGEVTKREVMGITLDDLARERHLEGPHLLKLDVQGAELDVLEGAGNTLEETEYVVLECCLYEFFAGGPLLAEVVGYMRARGFVVYDVLSIHYRPLDGAVSTLDLAFVKEASQLRRTHRFQWSPLT
jgi:FkbM family methyltransferase